jgi:hypothetical protein
MDPCSHGALLAPPAEREVAAEFGDVQVDPALASVARPMGTRIKECP